MSVDLKGDPTLSNKPNEFFLANSEYSAFIHQNKNLQPWYDFMLNTASMVKKGEGKLKQLENQLHHYLRKTYHLSQEVQLPSVGWVMDPGVQRTTGHDFYIPVLEFNADTIDVFKKINFFMVSQGTSVQIPPTELGLPSFTRDVSLVCIPSHQFDNKFPMSFDNRRRHELMHAVDPNLTKRTAVEGLMIDELAATVGEFTDDAHGDTLIVNVPEQFILFYLNQIGNQYATNSIAHSFNQWVYNRTKTIKNSDVSRSLMLSKENLHMREIMQPESIDIKILNL